MWATRVRLIVRQPRAVHSPSAKLYQMQLPVRLSRGSVRGKTRIASRPSASGSYRESLRSPWSAAEPPPPELRRRARRLLPFVMFAASSTRARTTRAPRGADALRRGVMANVASATAKSPSPSTVKVAAGPRSASQPGSQAVALGGGAHSLGGSPSSAGTGSARISRRRMPVTARPAPRTASAAWPGTWSFISAAATSSATPTTTSSVTFGTVASLGSVARSDDAAPTSARGASSRRASFERPAASMSTATAATSPSAWRASSGASALRASASSVVACWRTFASSTAWNRRTCSSSSSSRLLYALTLRAASAPSSHASPPKPELFPCAPRHAHRPGVTARSRS